MHRVANTKKNNERLWYLTSFRVHRLSRDNKITIFYFFADDMLLVAEANLRQAKLIKRTLDRFALASGQKVSQSKTRILFSKNIPRGGTKQVE
jgi:hypothetical protein